MIIVIEKYPYRKQVLLESIPEKFITEFQPTSYTDRDGQKRLAINTVGYCFIPELNDCVFFLPKVVLKQSNSEPVTLKDNQKEEEEEEYDVESGDEDKVMASDLVFGNHEPEKLLKDKNLLNDTENEFIYQLSVWIYRALNEFKHLNPESKVVKTEYGASLIDKSHNKKDFTFIDVLLSLFKFNDENQDFFIFVLKNIHRGYNKINWRKTIATKQPLMQDNSPIYMNPVNRKNQINFDEELLIIFFSILNYINEQYGFPVKINFNYELISGEKFKHYIDGYGIIRLKQIKYKYYSDKALKLWDLCSKFFERADSISSSTYKRDYMFSNSFQTVFEAIIDDLIGEHAKSLPTKLKKQKDRKIIDHLYKYGDLVHPYLPHTNEIYYIGDSKYYKIGASIEESSIYKQYTYAKNVIQYDFDLIFGKESKGTPIHYVDDLTEGYNITPNFFISADIKPPYIFEEKPPSIHTIKDKTGKDVPARYMNKQFKNRLFDRDTLWISHYDISFMTILFLYGRGNDYEKKSFKESARELFRREVIRTLKDNYEFSILVPREMFTLKQAVEINFQRLLGKIYCPNNISKSYVILALQRKVIDTSSLNEEQIKEQNEKLKNKNEELKKEIGSYFIIYDNYVLGSDVITFLDEKGTARAQFTTSKTEENSVGSLAAEPSVNYEMLSLPKDGVLMVMMMNYDKKCSKFINNGKIAIGLKNTDDSFEIIEHLKTLGFVLFHNRKDQGQHLFRIKGDCIKVKKEELESDIYKNISTTNKYIVVNIDTSKELDTSSIHCTNKKKPNKTRYDAQYATIEELKKE